MLLSSNSRLVARQITRRYEHCSRRCLSSFRYGSTSSSLSSKGTILTGALAVTLMAHHVVNDHHNQYMTFNAAKIPSSGDVVSMGMPTKEPQTGILFPALCNGMSLAGVGVRVKYAFVKVYAVGTYLDPIAMMAVKKGSKQDMEKALLDPTYPRTIRIVMNRGLSIDKYTAAIVEAIKPRLKGQELEKLGEFEKLNPPVDLVEGAEIEMTIRGDTLLYKNAVGGVGSLKSRLFCEALCDVYFGSDPVSPTHKESVLNGIPKL